ncbi:MAG TPA: DUF929 family protein [Mycobacteriales bacterium]|nr:DUF929 family protein [Mycobacteriales bacterium]
MGRETNRQRREKQAATAREKAAAARAAQARVDQRRRAKAILSSVVAAAVVIAVIAVVAINHKSKNSTLRPTAQAAIVDAVTGVTPATYNQVGMGRVSLSAVKAISDPALTQNGKPELLFVGAEFCPFCAAERWALVSALSRFGTFSDLKQIRSAVDDGNLATFSFYKSSYTSKYLAFNPIEYEDRNSNKLESISKSDQALWFKYTGQGSFPFLYYGGKYVQTQVGYSDSDLSGLTWTQIADDLKDPTSKIAQDVIGEANAITAMVCKMTNGQPGTVCSASGVSKVTLPQASA